jgi:hypothetical protein
MRVVLDTNIIVSALVALGGKPAAIVRVWLNGKFTLLTCSAHVDELRATLCKSRVAELIKPYKAGRLVNQVRKLAEDIHPLPRVERSPDPTDDFLLAMSEGGKADYLMTGDKSGLLALDRHKIHVDRFRWRIRRALCMNPKPFTEGASAVFHRLPTA